MWSFSTVADAVKWAGARFDEIAADSVRSLESDLLAHGWPVEDVDAAVADHRRAHAVARRAHLADFRAYAAEALHATSIERGVMVERTPTRARRRASSRRGGRG